MARRAHVDSARHLDIVVTEYALPGHLHLLEQDGAVGFIKACCQGIVELAHRIALIGLARPNAHAWRIKRHNTSDRFFLLPSGDGMQIAAPGLMAEY